MSSDWTSPSGDSERDADNRQQPAPGPGPGQPPQYGQQPPPPYGQGHDGPSGQPGQYGQQPPPQYGAGQYGQQPPPQYGQAPPPPQYGQGQYGFQGAPPYQPQYGGPGGYHLAPRPGVIPLRALSLSDVFEGAFRTIRGNPGATLGLSALVSLVVAIPTVLFTIGIDQIDPGTSSGRQVVVSLNQQGGSIFSSLAGIFLTGMLTVVLAEAVLGRRIGIGDSWKRVKGRLLPLLGVNILYGLIVLVTMVVAVLIGVLLGVTVSEGAGVAVGILLFLASIPLAIFLYVRLMFAGPVTVLEEQKVIASLKRSWELTRGLFWRTFGIALLASFLVGIVSFILSIPIGIIAGVASFSSIQDGSATMPLAALIATQVGGLLIAALTAPFTAGVTGLLYLDSRIRKEALDVTLMAAAQQDGPSEA